MGNVMSRTLAAAGLTHQLFTNPCAANMCMSGSLGVGSVVKRAKTARRDNGARTANVDNIGPRVSNRTEER